MIYIGWYRILRLHSICTLLDTSQTGPVVKQSQWWWGWRGEEFWTNPNSNVSRKKYFNDMWMFSTATNSSARANVIKFSIYYTTWNSCQIFLPRNSWEKVWGHRWRQNFCDFLKEKKSLSTPQKVASRALKIHFDSQAAEYGPSIFYQQY